MSANELEYAKLFGNVTENVNTSMVKCACVACNSCTCACSCRAISDMEDIEW